VSRLALMAIFILSAAGPAPAAWHRIVADIPGDSVYADSVIRITSDRLAGLIGFIPDDTVFIYIVSDAERFDSLAGNQIPDWGAGVAIPFRRLIVIKSPLILPGEKSLGELVAHEYAHIALARRTRYKPAPRWFDEGLAMYVSAEWDWIDNLAMGKAAILGMTMRLREIERLNRYGSDQANVAYAESYLAFKLFLDLYGQSGIGLFLDNLASGANIETAFLYATGAGSAVFEHEFGIHLSGNYNVVAVLVSSDLLWALLALLIVVGFILNRLRRRSRMKKLEEYDRLHSTDFDYGRGVEKPDEDSPWD